jgi:hypothetical protein
MATTTNYSWSTPDDTALVKDGASAIRSLGTAIDSTVFTNAGNAINKSIVDAAGDLIYGTADNTVARLALGTAGQVLKVNSGATAPEWGSASASKSFSLLNAGGTALTGATTITVSGLTGDDIYILINGASSANASSNMRLRLNADSTSKYSASGYGLTGTPALTTVIDGTPDSQTEITLTNLSSNAASVMGAWVQIRGASSSGIKLITTGAGSDAAGGSSHRQQSLQGTYTGTSAITSVSLISSTGNFDAGTIYVYGAN